MIALGSILYRALQSVPRKTPPALTCHHPTCTTRRLSHPRRERSGHASRRSADAKDACKDGTAAELGWIR